MFFHGTDTKLNIGDILLPGSKVKKDYGRSRHVYLIDSTRTRTVDEAINAAYVWGESTAAISGHNKIYVYQVEPLNTVEPDNCTDPVGEECVRIVNGEGARIIDMFVYHYNNPHPLA